MNIFSCKKGEDIQFSFHWPCARLNFYYCEDKLNSVETNETIQKKKAKTTYSQLAKAREAPTAT
jgi:hypothetical protein